MSEERYRLLYEEYRRKYDQLYEECCEQGKEIPLIHKKQVVQQKMTQMPMTQTPVMMTPVMTQTPVMMTPVMAAVPVSMNKFMPNYKGKKSVCDLVKEQEKESKKYKEKLRQTNLQLLEIKSELNRERGQKTRQMQEEERRRRMEEMTPNFNNPEIESGLGAQRTRQMQEKERERRIRQAEEAQRYANTFDEEQLSFVKYRQEEERRRRMEEMSPNVNNPEIEPGLGAQRTRQMQEKERERRIRQAEEAQRYANTFDEEQLSFVKYRQEEERRRRMEEMSPNFNNPEIEPGLGSQRTRQMQERQREERVRMEELSTLEPDILNSRSPEILQKRSLIRQGLEDMKIDRI